MIALEARAAGNSWKQSAEIAGVAVTSLREWRKHAIVRDTLNELVRDKLAGATATLVDATPLLAKELIRLLQVLQLLLLVRMLQQQIKELLRLVLITSR